MSKTKKPAKKAAPAKAAATAKKKTAPVVSPKKAAAPAKPAAKPALKNPPKPLAKKAEKPQAKTPPKAIVKIEPKIAAKSPVKPAVKTPVTAISSAKSVPAAKTVNPIAKPAEKAPAKGKKPSLDHDVAVKIITNHRKIHDQVAPTAKAKKKAGPIAFGLDDIEEYLRSHNSHKLNLYIPGQEDTRVSGKAGKTVVKPEIKPVENRQVTAVSVADLLGFNPFVNKNGATHEEELIPQKYRKYYRLLIELRDHVNEGLATHTEEALKKTGKEDTGDVSAYSQHMADAGSDSFDRDFALSLVNNENEALYEISEAIDRMKDGTYGVCEVTQKPIPPERLMAVPFTRYSAEGQREIEKNRRRGRRPAGGNPLIDMGEGISFGGSGEEGEAASEEV